MVFDSESGRERSITLPAGQKAKRYLVDISRSERARALLILSERGSLLCFGFEGVLRNVLDTGLCDSRAFGWIEDSRSFFIVSDTEIRFYGLEYDGKIKPYGRISSTRSLSNFSLSTCMTRRSGFFLPPNIFEDESSLLQVSDFPVFPSLHRYNQSVRNNARYEAGYKGAKVEWIYELVVAGSGFCKSISIFKKSGLQPLRMGLHFSGFHD